MSDRLLLCTDLDRTLLPNGVQAESPGARDLFSALAALPDVTLVYVTGRHHELMQNAINEYNLPQPVYAITDVGSKIYRHEDEQWHSWSDWESEIDSDWSGMSHATLRELFHDLADLQLQESNKQNTHKLSFYVSLRADRKALQNEMETRLATHGICASLIWSIDETAAIGLLDVLPKRANKLHAIEFLAEQIDFKLEDMLFAGDSGNDLAVLASAIPSVLVANASAKLKETAQISAAEHSDALYIAHGGFLNMNGNYSAGILEGVAHFHPRFVDALNNYIVFQKQQDIK
ncbi:Alpha,alpha-trehalose-phosphate synthase [UDP-forming] [hydrothermal vent metagenome]|uniref:Alpha,alpha-trehalose-phosphate synthase [UDP-forming] n=1 Tax=hydrothermal vent metagenome TaxID=652676 RepID=A0A3B1BEU7_9ZZZZ